MFPAPIPVIHVIFSAGHGLVINCAKAVVKGMEFASRRQGLLQSENSCEVLRGVLQNLPEVQV